MMIKGDIPDEEKTMHLTSWAKIVQAELDTLIAERQKKVEIYTEKKSKYDNVLAKKLKWINMVEKRLNRRRKQLEEIEKELKTLTNKNDA